MSGIAVEGRAVDRSQTAEEFGSASTAHAKAVMQEALCAQSSAHMDYEDRLGGRMKGLPYRFTKRLLDLVLGSVLLVLSFPVVALAAIMIWLESPGSPFFFQSRLGQNGQSFRIFKLRGMYSDARERFPDLYDYSAKKGLDFYFHLESDPRVTRVGRITRRTSIDELPNFWNVVTGDMSLVGPRPEIPEVLELYGSYRDEYLSVKPGITCLSKCTGRDKLTKFESIELDIKYIRERSLQKDMGILWRTFRNVVLRQDVY